MTRLGAINDLRRHTETLSADLQEAVSRVIQSGWFLLGKELEAFEHEFAEYCGTTHCVGVGSGTDALELALRAAGVEYGDRVLTVANAGGYTTCAILAIGAEPVFIDVDDETLLVNQTELLAAISSESPPAAAVVTHLYGRLIPGIAEIASCAVRKGIPLIEDCAQAHGAHIRGKRAGSFGDCACFSFYPTKNLGALGDGGAVVTSNAQVAERVRALRQYGWGSKYRIETSGGRNSRLDEIQAAALRIKLPKLDTWNVRRREVATRLTEGIHNPKVRCSANPNEDGVSHLYVVRTSDRQSLREHLASRGIASDVHYPLADYEQPALVKKYSAQRTPIAERACRELLTLPCFPEMTSDEISAVTAAVNSW